MPAPNAEHDPPVAHADPHAALCHEVADLAAGLRAALEIAGSFEVEQLFVPGGLAPRAAPPPVRRVPRSARAASPSPPPQASSHPAASRPAASRSAAGRPAPRRAAPTPPAPPAGAGQPAAAATLAELGQLLAGCTRCSLHKKRQNVVFARGNAAARLMFVGEGPGADEDEQGLPFVGKSGQLLDKIIGAMGLSPADDVYVANVVKCRPPGNRTPMFEEVQTCSPFLRQQIGFVKPEVIVALGATATRMLLGQNGTMRSFRGKWHDFEGTPLYATYHPAYLLRTPGEKRKVWDDMKVVMQRLGLQMPG